MLIYLTDLQHNNKEYTLDVSIEEARRAKGKE